MHSDGQIRGLIANGGGQYFDISVDKRGRVFPQAAWLALEDSNDSPLTWLRKRKYWVKRYLTLSVAEDEDLINTLDYTDAAVIECDEAARNLCRILAYYKRPDLERKLHVTPHSVFDEFLLQPMPGR